MSDMVSAIVVLFPRDKSFRKDVDTLITSENYEHFEPPAWALTKAKSYFSALGFQVETSEINLFISGDKAFFDKVFNTEIKLSKHPQTGGSVVDSEQGLDVPEELRNEVSKIVIPEAPEFFSKF